tara:strand:+ start:1839 stop:2006 length:168 start_codon:yes stop_codon:yes gene_type:complete
LNWRRIVRVLWTYPDAAVGQMAVCEVVRGGKRARTKIQVRRLRSPVFFRRVDDEA